jgi:hypothetical protein
MKTPTLLLCALLGTCLAAFSHQSIAAAAGDCDRACLNDMAEQYLAAIVSHDPSKAPMATSVRYTENGVELPLPDGLWRIASARRALRHAAGLGHGCPRARSAGSEGSLRGVSHVGWPKKFEGFWIEALEIRMD